MVLLYFVGFCLFGFFVFFNGNMISVVSCHHISGLLAAGMAGDLGCAAHLLWAL